MPRSIDIALVGATGFTGQLVAERLLEYAPEGLTLALAGRSLDKLKALVARLPTGAQRFVLREVDSTDLTKVRALTKESRVVCTTVGPYLKYGLPLMQACAEEGTHLCDLSGEVGFMRTTIDRFDATAKQTNARLVHSCGFDSIPSDLGLYALHRWLLQQKRSGEFVQATMAVISAKGGFSGGTIASMLSGLDAMRDDRSQRKVMADPYALSPDRAVEPTLGDEREQHGMVFDRFLNQWTAPFVMASINTRVVRRSNALLGYPYGRAMKYREVMAVRRGLRGLVRAAGVTAVSGLTGMALMSDALRPLVAKALPKPGQGPSEEQRRQGRFKVRHEVMTPDGSRAHCVVEGQGDPGYLATSKMLAESALCLALDDARLPQRFGVLTPATAFELVLVERLKARGFGFAPA